MPRLGALKKSKFWRAADLDERGVTLTIDGWEEVLLGPEKEPKHVLYFKEDSRGLPLNATREQALCEVFGSNVELDDLLGRRIRLVLGKTRYQGKTVDCMEIEAADNEVSF